MFVDVSLQDVVRVPVSKLSDDILPMIRLLLDSKFSNNVLPNQGLCICVNHISSTFEPYILPGDGGVHIRVEFTLILFRPFVYELMIGTVRHSDESGMLVSVQFCEDIFIPKENLQEPCFFDAEEKLWVWKYLDNDMYIDTNEKIRFRISSIEYPSQEDTPRDPSKPILLADLRPAMQIVAAINEDGLGLLSWWAQDDDDAEAMRVNQ